MTCRDCRDTGAILCPMCTAPAPDADRLNMLATPIRQAVHTWWIDMHQNDEPWSPHVFMRVVGAELRYRSITANEATLFDLWNFLYP